MSDMNVTYADLHDAATKLRSGMDDLQHKLTQLQSFIQGLVGSGFVTDQASGAFNDTYQNFTRGATQTVGALEQLGGFLDSAASALQDTDSSLAKSIASGS